MRQEEKEVDTYDLDRAQRLEQSSELEARNDEKLPPTMLDQARELAQTQRTELLRVIEAIFARDHLVLDTLQLPQHELRALEALKVAVEGRDAQIAQFVYAGDRRELLEQALAVLQPNLELDDPSYVHLVSEVSALRAELANLMDAQDELIEHQGHVLVAVTPGDKDDKGDKGDKSDNGASGLGPRASEEGRDATRQSTLYGPAAAEPEPQPSSLYGAERPPSRPVVSSLSGGGDAPSSEPATAAAPSTLGDARDTAAQPEPAPRRKPWWKRPFG